MRSYLLSMCVILSLISTVACLRPRDKSSDATLETTTAPSDASANPDKADAKVQRKVKRLIADELGLEEDEVDLETNLVDDLDADDAISVVNRLEEEFDLVVPDEDIEKLKTVRDMCDYVKQHRKK